MKIKLIIHPSKENINLNNVPEYTLVSDFKTHFGLNIDQKILYKGENLRDDQTLKDQGVNSGSTLLILNVSYGQKENIKELEKKREEDIALAKKDNIITLNITIMGEPGSEPKFDGKWETYKNKKVVELKSDLQEDANSELILLDVDDTNNIVLLNDKTLKDQGVEDNSYIQIIKNEGGTKWSPRRSKIYSTETEGDFKRFFVLIFLVITILLTMLNHKRRRTGW